MHVLNMHVLKLKKNIWEKALKENVLFNDKLCDRPQSGRWDGDALGVF